jgi:hypothetical protein
MELGIRNPTFGKAEQGCCSDEQKMQTRATRKMMNSRHAFSRPRARARMCQSVCGVQRTACPHFKTTDHIGEETSV